MAYKMKQRGLLRGVCYPSQIAADRPLLVTRMTWEENEEASGEAFNRGDAGEDRVARFNRQLREGHAGHNSGEE